MSSAFTSQLVPHVLNVAVASLDLMQKHDRLLGLNWVIYTQAVVSIKLHEKCSFAGSLSTELLV